MYLEPVFLNEKMTLNCAAYLWKGVALEAETSSTSDKSFSGKANAGLPFLRQFLNLFGIEAAGSVRQSDERKAIRRYTLGGLHMALLEQLRDRGMLVSLPWDKVGADDIDPQKSPYLDVQAVLQPVDFFEMLRTVQTAAPLLAQLARDFWVNRTSPGDRKQDVNARAKRVNDLEQTILGIAKTLETDYAASAQREFIMFTDGPDPQPFGVVDIDVADIDPGVVRARLSGGRFHVIGKLVRRYAPGQDLNLMERSVLSSVLQLLEQVASAGGDSSRADYQRAIADSTQWVERLIRTRINGPAIRMAAMSVCL